MSFTRSMLLLFAIVSLSTTGCSLDRAGLAGDDAAPVDRDASIGDASIDAPDVDSGPRPDGGPIDSGSEDAGRDGGPPPCVVSADRCADGIARVCNVGTGALEMRTCSELGCNASGTACAILLPSNVDPALFDGSAAAWNVTASTTYDTDACAEGMIVAQPAGPQICVRLVSALSVSSSTTLDVVGARPLVVLSQGDVVISGTIDLSARGATPRAGGGMGGSRASADGIGRHPGLRGNAELPYTDGGGGGGGFCGAGGAGGDASDTATGGAGGGLEDDTFALEPLVGGSGGGWARGAAGMGFDNAARGGSGGGAIQISARGSIVVTGAILAAGGGGEGGSATTDFNTNFGAGGGGGSGGGILLESATITVAVDARVWTTGGGGGGSADGEAVTGPDIARLGAAGEDGRLTGGRATGGAEGGPVYGASGGDSGGGGTSSGANGESNTSREGTNGGGAGGGVGCIVLRTASGDRPSDRSAFSGDTMAGLRGFPAEHD